MVRIDHTAKPPFLDWRSWEERKIVEVIWLMCEVVTLILSDAEFGKLMSGKANAQKLFMSGKLKVKGDVMKATKMEPVLKKAQDKAKL